MSILSGREPDAMKVRRNIALQRLSTLASVKNVDETHCNFQAGDVVSSRKMLLAVSFDAEDKNSKEASAESGQGVGCK